RGSGDGVFDSIRESSFRGLLPRIGLSASPGKKIQFYVAKGRRGGRKGERKKRPLLFSPSPPLPFSPPLHYASRARLSILTNSASGWTPIFLSTRFSPPLNSSTAGMLLMPYFTAISGLWSVFSLPTLTLPANWSASLSIVGPSIRHGPHQTAQKS